MRRCSLCLLCILLLTIPAQADEGAIPSRDQEIQALKQEIQDLKNQMREMHTTYTEVINKLQVRLEQLEREKTVSAAPTPAYEEKLNILQAIVDQLEEGQRGFLQGRWNPDIGVVGDIVFKLDSPKEDAEGADRVSVREMELVFGRDVDPYSRFDATVSFSDFEDTSLEEAYLTHFGLPYNVKARLGKLKPMVGKAIPIHRDSLDTVNEPLVIQRYFGVEGLNKSGLDFTKILPLPWEMTHQLNFGILEGGNGEEGTAFGATRRRPTIYSHLKNYVDLTDSTGFELGFNHMIGSRDADASFEVQVLGVDTTLTHHFNANQHLKLQSEVYNLNRQETEHETDELDGNLWGLYTLADVRLSPRWSTGFRFDYVEPVDNAPANPEKTEKGYTGYLTFYQSEFARWRVQFTHQDLTTGQEDNQFMLQGTFAIGEHKHKLQ